MAIIEITLEKPALIEEIQYPEDDSEAKSDRSKPSGKRERSQSSESSGGNAGKIVGLLALVAGVGLLAWKLRSGDGEQTDLDEYGDEKYEHGPEPDIGEDESGGATKKVASMLGLAVAATSLASVVRTRRN